MKKGFTLIELLVVISIISLLMSIMLPGLSNSRELAKRVTCGSNLRQFYFVWQMYSMDNDDKLCSPETYWTNDDHGIEASKGASWVAEGPVFADNPIGGTEQALKEGVLWKYDLVTKLFKCKSDSSKLLRSYSIPFSIGGGMANAFNSQGMPRASEKIIFLDSEIDPEWKVAWPSREDGMWLNGPFQLLNKESTIPGGPKCAVWGPVQGQRITLRHSNGSNFVFGDGSTSYRKWKDQRTIDYHEGKLSSEEASGNNEDLEWLHKSIAVRLN